MQCKQRSPPWTFIFSYGLFRAPAEAESRCAAGRIRYVAWRAVLAVEKLVVDYVGRRRLHYDVSQRKHVWCPLNSIVRYYLERYDFLPLVDAFTM